MTGPGSKMVASGVPSAGISALLIYLSELGGASMPTEVAVALAATLGAIARSVLN